VNIFFFFDVSYCKKENVWKLLLRYLDALLGVRAPQDVNVATLFVGVTYQGKGTRSSLGKRGLWRSFRK